MAVPLFRCKVRLVHVVQLEAHEWSRMRSLRLAALRDVPEAFLRSWEKERSKPDSWWEARMGPPAAHFVAVQGSRDVGLAVGAPYGETLGLYGMWVHASARGRRAGDGLVEAVIEWARQQGAAELRLDVGPDNLPAVALYTRHGFSRVASSCATARCVPMALRLAP